MEGKRGGMEGIGECVSWVWVTNLREVYSRFGDSECSFLFGYSEHLQCISH